MSILIESKKIRPVKITEVKEGMKGDRVCIDLTKKLSRNEGLLVGNYSRGLYLINNEVGPEEKEYDISPRPFRVNAGCVSAYVFMPDGNTKYLCELQAGDEVIAVNTKGEYRSIGVLRQKTEERPMTLIKGWSEYDRDPPIRSEEDLAYFNSYRQIFKWIDRETGKQIRDVFELRNYLNKSLKVEMESSTFCQTAETVSLLRAVNPENPEDRGAEMLPITKVRPGQYVYAYIKNPTIKGRHFGMEYAGFCLEI